MVLHYSGACSVGINILAGGRQRGGWTTRKDSDVSPESRGEEAVMPCGREEGPPARSTGGSERKAKQGDTCPPS